MVEGGEWETQVPIQALMSVLMCRSGLRKTVRNRSRSVSVEYCNTRCGKESLLVAVMMSCQ